MTTLPKIFSLIINGRRDNNVPFSDLQRLLDSLGFNHRTKAVIMFTGVKA